MKEGTEPLEAVLAKRLVTAASRYPNEAAKLFDRARATFTAKLGDEPAGKQTGTARERSARKPTPYTEK